MLMQNVSWMLGFELVKAKEASGDHGQVPFKLLDQRPPSPHAVLNKIDSAWHTLCVEIIAKFIPRTRFV